MTSIADVQSGAATGQVSAPADREMAPEGERDEA